MDKLWIQKEQPCLEQMLSRLKVRSLSDLHSRSLYICITMPHGRSGVRFITKIASIKFSDNVLSFYFDSRLSFTLGRGKEGEEVNNEFESMRQGAEAEITVLEFSSNGTWIACIVDADNPNKGDADVSQLLDVVLV